MYIPEIKKCIKVYKFCSLILQSALRTFIKGNTNSHSQKVSQKTCQCWKCSFKDKCDRCMFLSKHKTKRQATNRRLNFSYNNVFLTHYCMYTHQYNGPLHVIHSVNPSVGSKIPLASFLFFFHFSISISNININIHK